MSKNFYSKPNKAHLSDSLMVWCESDIGLIRASSFYTRNSRFERTTATNSKIFKKIIKTPYTFSW